LGEALQCLKYETFIKRSMLSLIMIAPETAVARINARAALQTVESCRCCVWQKASQPLYITCPSCHIIVEDDLAE
jgi:hypothetical protein